MCKLAFAVTMYTTVFQLYSVINRKKALVVLDFPNFVTVTCLDCTGFQRRKSIGFSWILKSKELNECCCHVLANIGTLALLCRLDIDRTRNIRFRNIILDPV